MSSIVELQSSWLRSGKRRLSDVDGVVGSDSGQRDYIKLNGSFETINSEFHVLEVSGSSYERGLHHGYTLRKIIRAAVGRFKYDIIVPAMKEHGLKPDYNTYHRYFFDKTHLLQTAMKNAEDHVKEIRGIAEGAGLSFEDLLVYNLGLDEIYCILEEMGKEEKSVVRDRLGHCTHGSVWNGKQTSVAYTWDWHRSFDGTQTLIKHNLPNDQVLLTIGYAGTIGGHGINVTHGYTFTAHSKFELAYNLNEGLGQIFIYRKILEAGSLTKACQLLSSVRLAVGTGYTISDSEKTVAFEVSANNVVEFKPGEQWMVMANVSRVNNDFSKSYLEKYDLTPEGIDMTKLPQKYWNDRKNNVSRFNAVKQKICENGPKDMTPAAWESLFSHSKISSPISEKDISTTNFWCTIEIDDKGITYCVSAGVPGVFPLEVFSFPK